MLCLDRQDQDALELVCNWKDSINFNFCLFAGAFGYFEVTHDITRYCKAKVFEHVGKTTPIAVRFSTVGTFLYGYYTGSSGVWTPNISIVILGLEMPGISVVTEVMTLRSLKRSQMVL